MNLAKLNPLNWFKRTKPVSTAAEEPANNWSPLLAGYGPGVNLLESDQAYHIELAVPGLSPDDLSVELEGNQLIISGAQSRQQSVEHAGRQWSVARTGFFQRRFTLPSDADAGKVDAQLKNGLLALSVARDKQRLPSRQTITIH